MSSSDPPAPSIDPSRFYKSSPAPSKLLKTDSTAVPRHVEMPSWMRSITEGPSLLWKVFNKQSDALKFSEDHGVGLMTFAFQDSDGSRHFLSAHPVTFWWYDSQVKQPDDRRTYEVIAENKLCKLYFDLEFEIEFNREHNGVHMTNTFIKIVSYFLREEFSVMCDRSLILDLDSTTISKFSRHLVFPHTYFRNNIHVGNFVKMICGKLTLLVLSSSTLKDFCCKCGLTEDDFKNLFVMNKHNFQKLFCDEAVYTKNRHFRVYKSTKWNKKSPLLISQENEFKPTLTSKERLPETQIFLDSLITHIGSVNDDLILEYGQSQSKTSLLTTSDSGVYPRQDLKSCTPKSPHPALDRFIESMVTPGRIRRCAYFSSVKKVTFEISGNRFCHRIGRPHKSNNIFYVVDLNRSVFYQKCFDPDCSGYQSDEKPLPPEICFMLESDDDEAFKSVSQLSDEDLLEVWEAVSTAAAVELVQESELLLGDRASSNFPEFGVSDTELINSTSFLDSSNLV